MKGGSDLHAQKAPSALRHHSTTAGRLALEDRTWKRCSDTRQDFADCMSLFRAATETGGTVACTHARMIDGTTLTFTIGLVCLPAGGTLGAAKATI